MKKNNLTEDAATVSRLEIRYSNFRNSARLPKRLAHRASAPLLLYPHSRWESAKVKLLVVGQETLRWRFEPAKLGTEGEAIRTFKEFSAATDGVTSMWDLYRWYSLGRQDSTMNSPFWRGFRTLDAAVNTEPDSAMWTNLFKVNVNGSVMRNCTRAEIDKIQKAQNGLLRHEIDVLSPDVIVFFTGPKYDSALRAEFADVEFAPFDRGQNSALPLSSLALLRAPGLPAKTVRTYHPEYLQRSRQLSLLSEIADWAKVKSATVRSSSF